jgi:hypothetical protein
MMGTRASVRFLRLTGISASSPYWVDSSRRTPSEDFSSGFGMGMMVFAVLFFDSESGIAMLPAKYSIYYSFFCRR